ncbi:putative late blight resistance protein homolog R1B-16 [Primulina tabacum]|uniref:putative late blight resistance protein homolog R1B-16 n=1 Tax=Primulina tabacum TaxID=48773 RepID=UPI003F5A2A90
MAEYAALLSLIHTSELILHPSQKWLRLHRKQIETLLKKARFLQEFLEEYSHRGHEELSGLESQIADMAYAAEDILESHVVDQVLARSTGSEAKSSTSFSGYIEKLTQEMEDLIETKVMRIKENIGSFEGDQTLVDFSPAVSSRLALNEQTTLVACDEKLIEIMDMLTRQQSNRQILAIVGMGGIGKTALAKKIYEDSYVAYYFHVRAWVTISQSYNAPRIISTLLSEINLSKKECVESDAHELDEQLYKSLCGRRYLIVMDDLWSIEAWDQIRMLFPDNCNGSRVMITTRLVNVARHLSSFEPFEMKCLDDDQSWELLCDKVFGNESCPSILEESGKNIAEKCGGLPLAIVVIGGLLAKANKTREFWGHVAENLNSVINSEDDENCQKILYLSYKNLPVHLKPCFLYMASLPEDSMFYIHSLVKVWIAEGFLKPVRDKTLEEVANEYIIDLIDRNLIFVRDRGPLGRIIACGVHDLLRDLCLREAKKENFICVIDEDSQDIPLRLDFKRRICFGLAPELCTRSILRPASLTRSVFSEFGWKTLLASCTRLLRVLDVVSDDTPPNDKEIMHLVNLRFSSITCKSDLNSMRWFSSSMSQFWSLQTLIFNHNLSKPIFLPSEIWNLPQLRHLLFDRVVLPDPPSEDDSHILENLQTLSTVLNFRCTMEVVKSVPNLKELKIIYDRSLPGAQWPFFCLHNLVHLHKLESLVFISFGRISVEHLSFPLSLKELNLSGCRLPWKDMTIVGSLPNLEMLELLFYAFEGKVWYPIEGQFVRLKLLVISKTDLLEWRADKTHFPILEHLILRNLQLEEIPRDITELPTLRKIELFNCSDSTVTSAKQILEEQESLENEGLQVLIYKTEFVSASSPATPSNQIF